MTTYGLTDTGLVVKTLEDIQTEMGESLKTGLGVASLDLSDQTVFGQLIGITAELMAECWDALEDLYSAWNPDTSSGAALDGVTALTGTVREAATHSTATVTCTGTASTVLAVGRVVSVAGTGVRFATTAEVTIAAATAWAGTTAYVVGDIREAGDWIVRCTTAGTSSSSEPTPTTQGQSITDGTVTWKVLGQGAGYVNAAVEAEDTGALVALAGTLTEIETPVSGWNHAWNITDATLGRALETDPALRARREDEIEAGEGGPLEAIRNAVLDVEDVTEVRAFENTTDTTDGDGLPPHSVEVVVLGGTDAAVAAAIFGSVAAGVATYGTDSEVVTDSQGEEHTVYFSRPTAKNIYVTLEGIKDPNTYPLDGDDQVEAALLAYGQPPPSGVFVTGKNVVSSALSAQAFAVAGVLDATAKIGLSSSPTGTTTIQIGLREIAVFDSARIVISMTDGTP